MFAASLPKKSKRVIEYADGIATIAHKKVDISAVTIESVIAKRSSSDSRQLMRSSRLG